jgi:hypothetical protein
MKKYILTFIALTTLWSCMTDEQYEDLNRDPKNPTQVSADFLFTAATVSLSDVLASPNVNINIFRFVAQYLTATTYLDEPNYDLTNRGIPENFWSEIYRDVIFDVQNAKEVVIDNPDLSQAEKDARLGQLEVIEVYAWHVLVDTFGDIPYSQALNAAEFPLPAYDAAPEIYADLISRLKTADGQLAAGEGFTNADVIYNGDMEKWSKFANSLLLRLGMRLSEVNPSLAADAATTAVQNGVFTSNDDSAVVVYQSNDPNTNPLWVDLVQSGRSDYVAANTVVDIMNDLEDPRRPVYFDDNIDGGYVGGIYGASNSYPTVTHIGQAFLDPTLPGILIDYAEVEFYLAEAAQRDFGVPGSAEDHYNDAIAASILYWTGSQAEVDAYLSQPEVAYDENDWKTQIGTQFWIAMFNNPFEGWGVWRKFDAPQFNLPEDTGNPVPLRYTYPVNEQNLNEANYSAASDAIGGDDQQTPIFWDVQ